MLIGTYANGVRIHCVLPDVVQRRRYAEAHGSLSRSLYSRIGIQSSSQKESYVLREWMTENSSWSEVHSYTNSCRVKIDHKIIRKDSSDLEIR